MKLTPQDIAKMLDHSTLQPFLTQERHSQGLRDRFEIRHGQRLRAPRRYAAGEGTAGWSDVKVCTVIGFPHGNHKPEIKLAEAEAALKDGCDELDMVH